MSTFNSVSEALELYVSPFDDEPQAWADVLRRASVAAEAKPVTRVRGRRRLLTSVAVAAATLVALGLSPVGGAVARGVSDFSAWLTGSPGESASEAAQRAFEEENERSWAGFPDGTELRRVITTEAAGATFELFGFRTGDSLCLRLAVDGFPNDGPTTGCAPLDELRRAEAPALAVRLDTSFGMRDVPPTEEGYVPARASASFGIVADGVKAVELQTTEGFAEAIVENNAFLAVTADPPLGLRSQELTAIGEQGERVAVALAEAPFGDYGPQAKREVAPGPKEVERRVEGGRIGWLAGREPRGVSLEEAGLDDRQVPLGGRREVRFARVIQPDPGGIRRVVVALVYVAPNQDPAWVGTQGEWLCYSVINKGGGGGGCSPVGRFFERGPFSLGITAEHGGDQYVVVNGLASDDVESMELHLRSGERVAVPLEDNAYLVEVARTKFPIRLVAYDDAGRVIGIETYANDPLADTGPRPVEGKQRVVKRVVGANGTVGTLRLGPSNEGALCSRVSFEGGASGGGCLPKGYRYRGPAVGVGIQDAGRDVFLTGNVSSRVATLELRFADGTTDTVEPIEGAALYALPGGRGVTGGLTLAIGLDRDGKEVGRKRFEPPHP